MATGDALLVGAAIPFNNWRGDRDYDCNGTPDGWGLAGSAQATWRRLQGTDGTYLRQWGLSGLGAIGLYSASASDYLWCRSRPYTVPAYGIHGALYFWCCPWKTPTDRIIAEIHILNAAGTSEGSNNVTSGTSPERGLWNRVGQNTPTFLTTTSSIEVRFRDAVLSADPARMMIDTPFVLFRPDAGTGGGRAMESQPSERGTSLYPSSLGEMDRDGDGGAYYADPYGATPKWTLTLNWEYMSQDDYCYWLACYAVNRGASPFKDAAGNRLQPLPIAVMHNFWWPTDYSDSLGEHYKNSGMAQVVIGNITTFDLRVREYVGFGYSGSVVIEES